MVEECTKDRVLKTYYLVYKITNRINNKFYIGAHKTKDKNDNYMGSSKVLKRSIAKYGKENFIKEILYEANSLEEMYLKEKEMVVIDRSISYNIKQGGIGGWEYVNDNGLCDRKGFLGKKHTVETRQKITEKLLGNTIWLGREHSEETKNKMSKVHRERENHIGAKNSQYGRMWITNGQISTRINKTDSIPVGWKKGRVNGMTKYIGSK